jgi:hypothetical protein
VEPAMHSKLEIRAGLFCILILLGLLLISWQKPAAVGSNSSPVLSQVADTPFNYSLGTKGNQIFFSDGYWFVFYYNGSDIVCNDGTILFKTSQDGENWSDPQIAADDANISGYFSVYQFNETVVVAYSSMQALSSDSFFNCVVRTRAGTISSTNIGWETPTILLSGSEIGGRICCYWGDYAFDRHWLAIEYLCGGYEYRCAIFSTTDFVDWSLSKDWINANGGYVSQVTLKFVENSRLIALYGSWASNEFNYMFYNGSDWSSEFVTSGAGLEYGLYKAQCEVVVNGTMFMLYSHWDYITDVRLGVYNGSWHFSDFLPDYRYWGGDSSVTFDRTTNGTYFFYIDAELNQVLAAYTTDYVNWVKDLKVDTANAEYIRRTRTSEFCDGSPAVAWIVGSNAPFQIKFALLPSDPVDVAVSGVTVFKTVVGQGYSMGINVTVENLGTQLETFNLTVYANATSFSTLTGVNLPSGDSTVILFVWNTTGYVYGNYTISAYAEPLPDDIDTANNNFTCLIPVHVGVAGDITGPYQGEPDGKVGMRDITWIIIHFNGKPGDPRWLPNCDINNDNVINMRDIQIAIVNFGKLE